jgi:hypothetical protein
MPVSRVRARYLKSCISAVWRSIEVAPGLGKAQTAGGAHEKLRAEMLLERRNLLADRRLPCSRATAEKLPLSTTRTNILMPSSRSIRSSPGKEATTSAEWIELHSGLVYSEIEGADGGLEPSRITAA